MKLKNIKAFEEFFYFDQEEERASNERPETDGCPDCGDDVATCDCVDYDDELRDYVKPSNREEEIYGDDDDYDKNFELAPVGEEDSEYDEEEEEEDDTNKPWGDEGIRLERFSTFNEKKKAPKKDDKKKDDEKTPKKTDFKDFDKDGDTKEPMTKALKDKEAKEEKGGKKFEKPKKGEIPAALAAYQKKKKK